MTKDLTKWLAFTLAEVLITLAIIGVVAALTIPTLLSNTNEKGLNTSDSVFQRRLGEALKVMNLQGTLQGQTNTQAFVNELGKHIKIMKTCPSNELSKCFVSEFQSGDETIEVKDLKASKNLYKTTDYGTETIGVVFGNGIRALVAYNPNCRQDQFDNSNTTSPVRLTTSGTGKNSIVNLGTDSLSILYNLQERKNNNVYSTTGNIRGKNILLSTGPECTPTTNGKCVSEVITSWEPLNTCDGTSPYDKWTEDDNWNCSENYWAGAQAKCKELGMSLPDKDTLVGLMKNDSWTGKPTSGFFWSVTELVTDTAWGVDTSGGAYGDFKISSNDDNKVLCVAN